MFLTQVKGRVDEHIGKLAGVSRDTVRKVETISQAVKQNPHLEYLVDRLDRDEISVNEANRIIEYSEAES